MVLEGTSDREVAGVYNISSSRALGLKDIMSERGSFARSTHPLGGSRSIGSSAASSSTPIQIDHLNGHNLLSLEVMFRRLQTIVMSLEEQQTFGGTTTLASTVMICTELLEHVKSEVERDASLAKNLRKAREERDMARRAAKKGGKAGDDGN